MQQLNQQIAVNRRKLLTSPFMQAMEYNALHMDGYYTWLTALQRVMQPIAHFIEPLLRRDEELAADIAATPGKLMAIPGDGFLHGLANDKDRANYIAATVCSIALQLPPIAFPCRYACDFPEEGKTRDLVATLEASPNFLADKAETLNYLLRVTFALGG